MDKIVIARELLHVAKGLVASTFAEFEDALKRHDWTYAYSDDFRYWNSGERSMNAIAQMAKELANLDPKRVELLYNQYGKAAFGDEWTHVPARTWLDANAHDKEQQQYVANLKKMLRDVGFEKGVVTKTGDFETNRLHTYYVMTTMPDGTELSLEAYEWNGGSKVGVNHWLASFDKQYLRPGGVKIGDLEKALRAKIEEYLQKAGKK